MSVLCKQLLRDAANNVPAVNFPIGEPAILSSSLLWLRTDESRRTAFTMSGGAVTSLAAHCSLHRGCLLRTRAIDGSSPLPSAVNNLSQLRAPIGRQTLEVGKRRVSFSRGIVPKVSGKNYPITEFAGRGHKSLLIDGNRLEAA